MGNQGSGAAAPAPGDALVIAIGKLTIAHQHIKDAGGTAGTLYRLSGAERERLRYELEELRLHCRRVLSDLSRVEMDR